MKPKDSFPVKLSLRSLVAQVTFNIRDFIFVILYYFSWKEPPKYKSFTKLNSYPASASVALSWGRRRERTLTFEYLLYPKHHAQCFVCIISFHFGNLVFISPVFTVLDLIISSLHMFVLLTRRSFLTSLVCGRVS